MVGLSSLLETRGSVLEELLLPAIEHRRLGPSSSQRSVISTPSTNASSERDLLFRGVVFPLLLHMFARLS